MVSCFGLTGNGDANPNQPDVVDDFLANYAAIAHASYEDSLLASQQLLNAVELFAQSPSSVTMQDAKDAWIAARQPYLQTEIFRYSGGPIDDEDGPESMLNGWPMDERYIDYVDGAPKAGMINEPDLYPEITVELIKTHNERAGETAITCGFHAIEFLLWGQDFNDDGPGDRPVSDYTTADHADRRKTYLLAATQLLVEQLGGLVQEWAPDAENFRAEFLADERSLTNVTAGYKDLAGIEFGGERLLVALDTMDQEDEHSCFSDTTHQDVIFNALGVVNLVEGSYKRLDGSKVDGAGLAAVANAFEVGLGDELSKSAVATLAATKEIPVPFDQAIANGIDAPGGQKIWTVVELFEDQVALIGKVQALAFKR